jgi:putative transposase
MILRAWQDLPVKYLAVEIDEFILMPNHIHGIIILPDVGAGPRACPVPFTNRHPDGDQLNWGQLNQEGQPRGVAPTTTQLALTDIMHRFKSFTTSQYRTSVLQNNWPHSPVNYGSAIITNASSAMRMN